MFFGLVDQLGHAVPPTIVDRVPTEMVVWSVEYSAVNAVRITNVNLLMMRVHADIAHRISKISLFREIDDEKPFAPLFDLRHALRSLAAGDSVCLSERSLELTLRFSQNEPDIGELTTEIDHLRSDASRHLEFIHKIAFTATGDLRALARNYLQALEKI
jgi:hypothetical protein